jgi:plasmid maintenance system antidote protein VapI
MAQCGVELDIIKTKAEIEAQGRTISWLAKQIGVNPQRLQRAINGKQRVAMPTARLLAISLGLPPNALVKS